MGKQVIELSDSSSLAVSDSGSGAGCFVYLTIEKDSKFISTEIKVRLTSEQARALADELILAAKVVEI